jgi:bifunctional DNA-binding transcriptional regulator/antitoxin component of YhaV-PrlF toxin-antitoxin module
MTILTIDEAFREIPGDDNHVMLVIPPDILDQLGWEEGTKLIITATEHQITIKKHE